jgi:hypothetical protein
MKCPECSYEIKLKGHETYVSCPDCLSRINTLSGKEVAKQTSSFHHYDSGVAGFTEYSTVGVSDVTSELQDMCCLLCGVRKSELHMVRASILGARSLIKQQTVLAASKEAKLNGYDVVIQGDLGDIITKKVKIPSYNSGYICDSVSCTNEFNRMCSTRDPQFHLPQAKTVYVPMKDSIVEDVYDLGLPIEIKTNEELIELIESSDADYTEIETIGTFRSLGLKFHRAEDVAGVSIQERNAKRNRVAQLKPEKQNLFSKPSKKVRDMRKMVKG